MKKQLPCSVRKLVLLMEWAAGGKPGTVNVQVPLPKPPPNKGPTATKEYVYAILRNRALIPAAEHSDNIIRHDIKIDAELYIQTHTYDTKNNICIQGEI